MGIGSKCVSEDFQELSFSDFQAFLRRGCTSFNPFLTNLDNSPHLTVFYSRFLLDAFTPMNTLHIIGIHIQWQWEIIEFIEADCISAKLGPLRIVCMCNSCMIFSYQEALL